MKIPIVVTLLLFTIGIPVARAQQKRLVTDTTLARKWYDQGLSLQQKGSYDSANVLFEKAAILYQKHQQWAQQLDCDNRFTRSLFLMGKYEEALRKARQTIQESLDKLGGDITKEAYSYNNIGNVYYDKGEYDQALEYFQKALRIRLKTLGETHPDVAGSYNNLGSTYKAKGEYDKALEYYQKTLQIGRKVLGETHRSVAGSYNNLGIVYKAKGEYDKALEYYQKALQLWREALGETHLDVALSYQNIGNVYKIKGEYDKALEYQQKALKIRQKALGESHPRVGDSYYDIGDIYQAKGDYEQALAYYQKDLQITVKVLGESHPNIGNSYTNIGNIYVAKGEYRKALEYYQKALPVYLTSLGKAHPFVSISHNNIGNVYIATGEYGKALQQFQKAILANTPFFHDTLIAHNPILTHQISPFLDGVLLLTSLQAKASSFEKLFTQSRTISDLRLAYQTYCSADTLAQQLQQNYSGETDKVAFTSRAEQVYQKALPLCLQLHQLTKDKAYLNQAFYFAERSKASVLSATLAESKAKTFASIADSLLAHDQQLRTHIAQYTQQVAEELTRGEAADSSKLNAYQGQLFEAHRQQEHLISQLEKDYPEYYQLKYQPVTTTPQQLQAALDEKTAVLEYCLADTLLQIFTLTRGSFQVHSLPLDSSFHRQIAAFREAMLTQDEDLYQQVAYHLYQVLLPPSLSKSIQQLIIIPEGELTNLPFEALLTKKQGRKAGKPNAYLLHQYAISYAYSARLLYERLIQPKEDTTKQLLALAPVFADTLTNALMASNRAVLTHHQPDGDRHSPMAYASSNTAKDTTAKAGNGGRLRGWLLDGEYVAPLLASEREVEAIARLFRAKGAGAEVYLNEQAGEERLKTMDVSRYNYLHLATHGFVNESYPELSGLLLAQDRTSKEDGILYTGEIYNLRLQAELVTLSACETGLGKLARGEGVIGLSRALLYAGARNLVVSFWKVPDESTADLMTDFYAALLSGQDKAGALQLAKRKMLRQGKYSHPFYWAPFILVGK